MFSGYFGSSEQLLSRKRGSCRLIFLNAAAAALLPQMFAQKLAGARIDQTNVDLVPLNVNAPADPAGGAL